MTITVFYDYICPYCYLATKRLEKLGSEFDIELEWKGIEIHPEFPARGLKRSATLKSRVFKENIRLMAEEDDLEIRLPGFATNSRLSLEASEFANTKGVFGRFHSAVYEAYFKDRRNIGDPRVIIEIGEKSGLDRSELANCLSKRIMSPKIEENKKAARELQILGVPSLVINNLPITGNQSLDTLRKLIKRSMERPIHA